MKTLSTLAIGALLLASGGPLHSQQQPAPRTPEAVLAEIRAAQDALLKAQTATLERLELLDKEAEQLRIFSKRS